MIVELLKLNMNFLPIVLFSVFLGGQVSCVYTRSNVTRRVSDASWVAPMFRNGVVLQKAPQRPLIWGTGDPADTITADLFNSEGHLVIEFGCLVDDDGTWQMSIPGQEAGVGYRLAILKGDEEVSIDDVAFGDVWVCSGQSNMEFQLGSMYDAEKEIASIVETTPEMRIFRVKHATRPEVKEDFEEKDIQYNWGKAGENGQNLRQFSAICALFGNYQQMKLGYPVGLIESSWGGTFIEPWSTPEGIEKCGIPPDTQTAEQEKNNYLFNAMIHPLMKFSIEGVIWYQGEQNAGYPGAYVSYNLDKYACAFRELIGEWRRYWYEKSYGKTNEKFPFGFVQLAAFSDQRDHYTWPKLRFHQTSDYSYVPNDSMENTFMAVAMDTNDPAFDSLHPPHKREPALRLAIAAYHQHYLQNTFDQPRVVRACEEAAIGGAFNAKFEFSHQITLTHDTDAKGFTACCENNYELCNEKESWVDLSILGIESDGMSLVVDLSSAYEHCPDWTNSPGTLGYMWMETPCPTLLDCQLYVVGCDQLTEDCDDETLKFPITPWSGSFSDECV